jgi:hypothetical protein
MSFSPCASLYLPHAQPLSPVGTSSSPWQPCSHGTPPCFLLPPVPSRGRVPLRSPYSPAEAPSRAPLQPWPRLPCSGSSARVAPSSSTRPELLHRVGCSSLRPSPMAPWSPSSASFLQPVVLAVSPFLATSQFFPIWLVLVVTPPVARQSRSPLLLSFPAAPELPSLLELELRLLSARRGASFLQSSPPPPPISLARSAPISMAAASSSELVPMPHAPLLLFLRCPVPVQQSPSFLCPTVRFPWPMLGPARFGLHLCARADPLSRLALWWSSSPSSPPVFNHGCRSSWMVHKLRRSMSRLQHQRPCSCSSMAASCAFRCSCACYREAPCSVLLCRIVVRAKLLAVEHCRSCETVRSRHRVRDARVGHGETLRVLVSEPARPQPRFALRVAARRVLPLSAP